MQRLPDRAVAVSLQPRPTLYFSDCRLLYCLKPNSSWLTMKYSQGSSRPEQQSSAERVSLTGVSNKCRACAGRPKQDKINTDGWAAHRMQE